MNVTPPHPGPASPWASIVVATSISLAFAVVLGFGAYSLHSSCSPVGLMLCLILGDESFDRGWFFFTARSFEPITASTLLGGVAAGFAVAAMTMLPILIVHGVRRAWRQAATLLAVWSPLLLVGQTAAVLFLPAGDLKPELWFVAVLAIVLPVLLLARGVRFVQSSLGNWTVGSESPEKAQLSIAGMMIFTTLIGLECMLIRNLAVGTEAEIFLVAVPATVACLWFGGLALRRHVGRRTWLNLAGVWLPWLILGGVTVSGAVRLDLDHFSLYAMLLGFTIASRITARAMSEYGWREFEFGLPLSSLTRPRST